MIVTTKERK